jgi:hypothetical protein
MILAEVAPIVSAFAVAWLAVAIYQWATAMPARLARLIAKDRRATVTAAVQRCETLSRQVSTLSAVNESLRFQLLAARADRRAALEEAELARDQAVRFACAASAEEGDTPVGLRDTVRSPPPDPSGGSDDSHEGRGDGRRREICLARLGTVRAVLASGASSRAGRQ